MTITYNDIDFATYLSIPLLQKMARCDLCYFRAKMQGKPVEMNRKKYI